MVGKKIEQRAKEVGMSVRELSKRSGVHLQTLYGYIYRDSSPLCSTMKKIADALGKPVDWFLEPGGIEGFGDLSPEEQKAVYKVVQRIKKQRTGGGNKK